MWFEEKFILSLAAPKDSSWRSCGLESPVIPALLEPLIELALCLQSSGVVSVRNNTRGTPRPGRFARQPMFYCFRTVVEGADMAVAVVGIKNRRWSTEPFVSDQSRCGDPFAGRRGSDSCVREQSLILFQTALFYIQTETERRVAASKRIVFYYNGKREIVKSDLG